MPPIKVSRKMIWIARAVFLSVFIIWVAGIFYFHSKVRATERQIQELRQKKQRQEEMLRQEAILRQVAAQQYAPDQNRVQNAVDAFKQ